ncbi:MAG: hypothetical protein CBC63_05295 [Euryarchaeota archaeon TMED103]|nr:MAG: hypothetical protein CBC63_05295 [Euryarchaeota archaeon TMED103]
MNCFVLDAEEKLHQWCWRTLHHPMTAVSWLLIPNPIQQIDCQENRCKLDCWLQSQSLTTTIRDLQHLRQTLGSQDDRLINSKWNCSVRQ